MSKVRTAHTVTFKIWKDGNLIKTFHIDDITEFGERVLNDGNAANNVFKEMIHDAKIIHSKSHFSLTKVESTITVERLMSIKLKGGIRQDEKWMVG